MSAPTTRRELRVQRGAAPEPPPARTVAPRRVGSFFADALLWVAAGVGVVCLVLVILAFTMNISLIMFRTGSMSPTIPAGSVAVVQQIPAADIAVGDIVTVDRPGDLPVTHRVRSVEAGPEADQRIIVMRGDANTEDDPAPYTVSTVRVVLFSIPGLAPVIVLFGNPFVLGAITIAASLLVGWAFWPREKHAPDAPAAVSGGAS